MSELNAQEQELVDAAHAAMRNAYARYSNFHVGAALRMTDGSILTGSNFENASTGLSLCAETVAIASANAQGRLRDIVAVAVTGALHGGASSDIVTPCGRCRQILNEAQDVVNAGLGSGTRDIAILCASSDGSQVARFDLGFLLPNAFGPKNLDG